MYQMDEWMKTIVKLHAVTNTPTSFLCRHCPSGRLLLLLLHMKAHSAPYSMILKGSIAGKFHHWKRLIHGFVNENWLFFFHSGSCAWRSDNPFKHSRLSLFGFKVRHHYFCPQPGLNPHECVRSCFPSSSSLSSEVWRGKDRPQRSEVGCDRPGAEPPQAPSGPARLPALLGNPRQVCLYSCLFMYSLFDLYENVFQSY